MFLNNKNIPSKYTCDGENINPPLTFSDIPQNTQSLVLIAEDLDSPSKNFTHWLVYDIPPNTLQILENEVPLGSAQGLNNYQNVRYDGPCPPSGEHHYTFTLYAIDCLLNLDEGASKEEVKEKMKDCIIKTSQLTGTYTKK